LHPLEIEHKAYQRLAKIHNHQVARDTVEMLNKAIVNGGVNTKSNIFIKNEVLPSGG